MKLFEIPFAKIILLRKDIAEVIIKLKSRSKSN